MTITIKLKFNDGDAIFYLSKTKEINLLDAEFDLLQRTFITRTKMTMFALMMRTRGSNRDTILARYTNQHLFMFERE